VLNTGCVLTDYMYDERELPRLIDEYGYFSRRTARTQRQDGIGHAEQRFQIAMSPRIGGGRGSHLSDAHAREMQTAMLCTCSELEEPGFRQTIAMSLPRLDPWPRWELARELALGQYGDLLTGVDFCGFEEGHAPKDKARFFAEVHGFNRRHPERALAESFEDKSLERAVRWVHEAAELGTHRLGHAIALGIDPDAYGPHERSESAGERADQLRYDLKHADGLRSACVEVDEPAVEAELLRVEALPSDTGLIVKYGAERLEEVRRRQEFAAGRVRELGAVVEVCPTSNRRIGGIASPDHHPVHRFLDWGLPMAIGSDDPGIFDTTLADEIRWVVETAGLGDGAFEDLAAQVWGYRSEVLTGRERRATP